MMKHWLPWALLAALALGLVGYYLPWVNHATAGFTMNAFDFAEWSSLHPAVRSSTPPLLTSFLLRAPHALLAIGLALAANLWVDPRARTAGWIVALALAVRFVPPSDFFQGATGDPNYRQMALLMALGVAGVLAAALLGQVDRRGSLGALAAAAALGVITAWAGQTRALVLLDNFEIAVSHGSGIALYTMASAMIMLLAGLGMWRRRGVHGEWTQAHGALAV